MKLLPTLPLVAFLAAAATAQNVIHPRHPSLPPMLFGRPAGGFLHSSYHVYNREVAAAGDDPYPWLIRGNFSQKYDHFSPLDTRKWKQRFWNNPKFFDPKIINDGRDLIFLFIGGEGPESDRWAAKEDVMYLQWAKKFGANVFTLEHRFFGESRPINDMKTSSLRLLTTEQALADLAFFIESMNKVHGFRDPKWITFGGSYPGSLSAWFRSKYPELTVGAVASSAPLNLKLDFFEYAVVVDEVISETSQSCRRAVKDAFDEMQQLAISTQGRDRLNRIFHLEPPFNNSTTKADINNFFANIYNIFQGMIQYTYDGANDATKTNLTASKLCEIMTKSDAVVNNVYDLYLWYSIFYPTATENPTQFANNYQDVVRTLGETNYSRMSDDTASYRGWTWLCCNEIGFLQTTDAGRGIFGSTLPVNYFYDLCTDIFGDDIKAEFIRDRNREAKRYYGGEFGFEATNLVLPNGLYDPWHALGYYPSKEEAKKNLLSVGTPGVAHCSDMYPPYPGEPEGLAFTRKFIEEALDRFIRNAEPTDAPPSTATPSSQPSQETATLAVDSSTVSMPPSTTSSSTTVVSSLFLLPAISHFMRLFQH